MYCRNLKDCKFTKNDLIGINGLIKSNIMPNARVEDDNEVVVDCGGLVGHLYNYRDMDVPGHPMKMRTVVMYADDSAKVPFGQTWDIPGVDVLSKVLHFYNAVNWYATARKEFNQL